MGLKPESDVGITEDIKMNIFERPELNKRIEHYSKISKVFALIGPKGVGKSTLVRHWLNTQNIKSIKWINLQSTFSLVELLSPIQKENSSLEATLEQYASQLNQYEAIVWDDFQHLPEKHLITLISFIKSLTNSPTQIILADEDHSIIKSELAFIVCAPLNEYETETYLRDFLNVKTTDSVQNIINATGGLPYLLNLWSQAEEHQSILGEAILPRFSFEEKVALAFLFFYGSISIEHPSAIALKPLVSKFYVQKNNGLFSLQSYLIDVVDKYFQKSEKQKGAKLAIAILKTQNNEALNFSIWLIAVKVDLSEEENEYQKFVDPKSLENLGKTDLMMIFNKLSSKINLNQFASLQDYYLRTIRLFLQAGILIGERKSTLTKLIPLTYELVRVEQPSVETGWLAYELIYWINRSNHFREANQLLDYYQNRVQGELKLLFQLELAFPFTVNDPQRALLTLKRVASAIAANKQNSLRLIHAQTLLQMATCYFNLEDRIEALRFYTQAENLYEEIHQSYFAMICRINRLLLLINSLDINDCENLLSKLFFTANRFGYSYLLSGAYYIQAIIDRENFKRSSAIDNIKKSLSLIPEGAPPRSTQSVFQEEIGVLISLGKFREAENIFNVKLKNKASVSCQIEFADLSYEDAQDQWQKSLKSEDNTEFLRFKLLHGQNIDDRTVKHLNKTPWGRWTLLENKLHMLTASNADNESILKVFNNMEYILVGINDQTPEHFALEILKWQLNENINPISTKEKLEEIRVKIQNWSADHVIKAPLLAICDKLADASVELDSHLDWKTARQIDKPRWFSWMLKKTEISKSNFILISLDKQSQLQKKTLNDLDLNVNRDFELVLIEHLGAVYYNQIEVKEFHRKAVLRQLLAFILEVYPNEIDKTQMANIIWGEAYSPGSHDSRIYTSIQRLRQLLNSEMIESWNGGYRWNSKFTFAYIKSENAQSIGQHKVQTLIIQILQNYQKSGTIWISRSALVEATKSSESTVKRELSKLLLSGQIARKGSGPNVLYALAGN